MPDQAFPPELCSRSGSGVKTGCRISGSATSSACPRPTSWRSAAAWGWSATPTGPVPPIPGWKGGRHVDRDGYVQVWIPSDDPMACMADSLGRVPEHRLVMARHLGRPLTRAEKVRHRNADRADNQIKNLRLRKDNPDNGSAM